MMDPKQKSSDNQQDNLLGENFAGVLKTLKEKIPYILSFPIRLPILNRISDITQRGVKMNWPGETVRIMQQMPAEGIFHTGIENSDPFVEGGVRRNQLKEAFDFLENYEQRLERIHALGIKWLRFGPPYSQTHLNRQQYDFSFTDRVMEKCQQLDITIIADLLHFGLPDWLRGDDPNQSFFQNPEFPEEFAGYAGTFVKRYPHIRYITLINEPFVTANFSAKLGIWNESRRSEWHDDREFLKTIANIARAVILARQEVEWVWASEHRPDEPIFVQNESFEVTLAEPGSEREPEAKQFNFRRFVALDLIFGHFDAAIKNYVQQHGMTAGQYDWFMRRGDSSKTILGIDHYPWCVYTLEPDSGVSVDPLQRYQLYELTKEYWQRYKTPLLHTEVNAPPELATAMCQKTYDVLLQLRDEGYPIIGMGWYGDEYQVGWQHYLVGPESYQEYPVGLHYKGQPQPVALLFKQFSKQGLQSARPAATIKRRPLL